MMVQHYSRWSRPADDRYYELYLEQDLLGDWALTRVWGRRASPLGRVTIQGYASLQFAVERLIEELTRRNQHRYERLC
jgi:predicted DNA-binding WGR domain protein